MTTTTRKKEDDTLQFQRDTICVSQRSYERNTTLCSDITNAMELGNKLYPKKLSTCTKCVLR